MEKTFSIQQMTLVTRLHAQQQEMQGIACITDVSHKE